MPSLPTPLKPGDEWDAGQNVEGPMDQRGRWTIRREAEKVIVFYHYFFPKHEVVLKTFEDTEEEAARDYAREYCKERIFLPQT